MSWTSLEAGDRVGNKKDLPKSPTWEILTREPPKHYRPVSSGNKGIKVAFFLQRPQQPVSCFSSSVAWQYDLGKERPLILKPSGGVWSLSPQSRRPFGL